MSHLPRLGYPGTPPPPRKVNMGLIAFVFALIIVFGLLVVTVVLSTPTCAKASTNETVFYYAPQVERGTTVTLVDGVPVTTPTPQGNK